MASELIERMNVLVQELENQALMDRKGREGLQICLKLRELKITAFRAGIEYEKGRNSPLNGIAVIH